MHPKAPVAISRCLLGEQVRYNGDHKHNRFCTGVLAEYFEFVPVCPEIQAGMSVPRKPIRLVLEEDEQIRARESDDASADHTVALEQQAHLFVQDNSAIAGFIAAPNSPSCGLFTVKLYLPNGNPVNKTSGLFSKTLRQLNPLLPVEESGRLNDPGLRENFIMRVYTYHRWQELNRQPLTANGLVQFHTRHKYLVMSHSHEAYKNLGQMVARAGNSDLTQLGPDYIRTLMDAIAAPAPRVRHCNVLHHLLGYLKKLINSNDKQELLATIEHYRQGIVPLIVPMALLRHHFERWRGQQRYVLEQVYLDPYPFELGLRSQVHP
ncbi:MAG: YbgA family protein [Pseudomonadota bacterium]